MHAVTAANASGSARLLLVEDEPLIRLALFEELTALGFCVADAGSAREALRKVGDVEGDIHAAIIDFHLPDKNGDALTDDLRALLPELPVVIVSAYRDDMLRACFGRREQISFLGKPCRVQELVPVLHVFGIDPGTQQ